MTFKRGGALLSVLLFVFSAFAYPQTADAQRNKTPDWQKVPIVYQTYGYVGSDGVAHHRYCLGEDSQWLNPILTGGDLQPGETRLVTFSAQQDLPDGTSTSYLPTDGIHICDRYTDGLDAGNARVVIHVSAKQLDGITATLIAVGPELVENNIPKRTPFVVYGTSLTSAIMPHTNWQDAPCPWGGNVVSYSGAGHAGVYNIEIKNTTSRVKRGVQVYFEMFADFCQAGAKIPPEYHGLTDFIKALLAAEAQ